MNSELPVVQAWFKKGRGTRDQITNIRWSIEKARDSRKTSTSPLLTTPKPLTVWITNCGKFFKRWNTRPAYLPPEKYVCRSNATIRTGHETTDWFQIGKGLCQGCILSPCLFNLQAEYIREMLGWMKHKLESRIPGEISITSDMQMTPPLWQKVKEN